MQTKPAVTEVLWPEKIAVIYRQFPWLEKVYPQANTDRAYVKRIGDEVLDLETETFSVDIGFETVHMVTVTKVSLYFINQQGVSTQIGKMLRKRKKFSWIRLRFVEVEEIVYINRSVRNEIKLNRNLADETVFIVMVKHAERSLADSEDENNTKAMTNDVTIFKPAWKEITLGSWYTSTLEQVESFVTEQIKLC